MKKDRKDLFFSGKIYPGWITVLCRGWIGALVIMLTVTFSASAQSQRVTIDVSKVDAKVIFKLVKEQTGLTYMYKEEDLKVINPVSLQVNNVTVDSAMRKLFAGTPLKFEYEGGAIVISRKEVTQQREEVTYSGVVTDQQGNTLPGVSVILKGTAVGTATDVNGKFRFTMVKQRNPVLIFSFIGMKRLEYTVKDDKPLNIKLEDDSSELDEVNVISTGYYDVDKRLSTSAVTSLRAEDVLVAGVSTIDQMLEGRVPGMMYMQNSGQVGATPKLKVRGTTTLLGSTQPLWVLDGVILSDPVNVDPADINNLDFVNLLGNAISGLNPEDIDRIDVLKDASATAIYGPKASNGVIVITTKKGKVGRLSVSYSVSGTYRQRPRYTDRAVNVMNSKERIDYSREVIEKGMVTGVLSSWVGYEATLYDMYNKNISYKEFEEQVADMETINTDWLDVLLKDSFSHNHTLTFSGGSDHVRYYTSLGLNSESGAIRKESNKRYSARANININYDKFSMSFSLSGNVQKRQYTPAEVGVTDYAYNSSRAIRAYNDDGSLWFYQRAGTGDLENNYNKDTPFSIINEMNNTYDKIKTDQISLSVAPAYQIIPSLKASLQFSYGVSNTQEDVYFSEDTWYAANLRYFQTTTNDVNRSFSTLPKGGELRLDRTRNENYSMRAQLLFNHYLDDENIHQITTSLIGELTSSHYTGFKITRRGYMPDRGMIIDEIYDSSKPYTGYNNWLLQTPEARGIMKDQLTNTAGLIGVVTYTYKNVYVINANARIDASNKFGDRSNEKLLPIWSVSGRWNLHENVVKSKNWINTLAIISSFGYQGNMSNQDSPKLQLEKKGIHTFFKEYYSNIRYFPNPYLKWEKTMNVNVGLDFALFNNKLNGTISYYFRQTTDAFMSKTVSGINGVRKYTVNRGTLRNQGYDLSLNFVPINTMLSQASLGGKKRGFVWRFDPNFGAVFNQLVNKLNSKNKSLQDEVGFQNYLDGSVYISGKPVNTFYSYRFKGLSPKDGRPIFYNTDPTTVVDGEEMKTRELYLSMEEEEVIMKTMTRSGCREPFLQGGFSNYLGWRSWGLSFNLAYSVGSKIRLFKLYSSMNGKRMAPGPEKNMSKFLVDRWRQPGDELRTTIPGLLDNAAYQNTLTSGDDNWWTNMSKNKFAENIWTMYDQSDLRVVSGNYLRMQSLSLRYVVPESFLQKLFLKSAYLSASGTNIFTICSKKLKGQDPSQSGTTSLINLSVRPTYSFQLNVTF